MRPWRPSSTQTLSEDPDDPLFVGGNFWDGRATGWKLGNPAADQAQGPFLNPVEQALPDAACVVYRVCEGTYGDLFDTVWGPEACMIDWPGNGIVNQQCVKSDGEVPLAEEERTKVESTYDLIALAVAAFEGSAVSNAFTSKLDAVRAGLATFTEQEADGARHLPRQGNVRGLSRRLAPGWTGAPVDGLHLRQPGCAEEPAESDLHRRPGLGGPGPGGLSGDSR